MAEVASGDHSLQKENNSFGSGWYFSRKEIEENSASRSDGIDLKKETYLRKSYCTFLQDLGMRLKVPQVTIATAIVFCHRFFLRQSHAKNDRRTSATVCMFLAGKVEETPRPLKDVILVSYEIIHKKDPAAAQRIKQREVYEQQKELILLGERLVLATLGFDLNVHHPYKPLVEAIKKFNVAQNALAQVAWNFVNDGLRTSLCLQFKPHHIAAGAIFLAAKFLKVKLPSDGEKVWWQEFDVTPRQLEEVSNQMLELYEQNRAAASSHGNENESSATDTHRAPSKGSVQERQVQSGYSQAAGTTSIQQSTMTSSSTGPPFDQQHLVKPVNSNDHDKRDKKSGNPDFKPEDGFQDLGHTEYGNAFESSSSKHGSVHHLKDLGLPPSGLNSEQKDNKIIDHSEASKSYTPMDAMKKIDKDKVKAALEKRKKNRGEIHRKIDVVDEDDLIEHELESGVELAVEDERMKHEGKHVWSESSHKQDSQIHEKATMDNVEEGEFSSETSNCHSPDLISRKRKTIGPNKHNFTDKERHSDNYGSSYKYQESLDERDHKRHRQENHV